MILQILYFLIIIRIFALFFNGLSSLVIGYLDWASFWTKEQIKTLVKTK